VSLLEGLEHRQQGGGLGGVAFEAVHLQREPGRVDEQPDLDLRIHPAFLAHPDPAQLVIVLRLEVQRGDVVEHHRQRAGAGCVVEAGRGELAAVVPLRAAAQRPEQRPQRRGRGTDLIQDADRVRLRGRLDHPGQDQRPERLVGDDVEPEPRVSLAEDLPQQLRRGSENAPTCTDLARSASARTRTGHGPSSFAIEASRPRVGPVRDIAHPRRRGGELTEVEGLLAGREPLAGSRQQQREFSIGVG
jgi:hypothetical protein